MAFKFSIIVPVYNVENYLDEALSSLLRQDYKNFEVILINDGSTDRSKGICLSYSNKYSNFLYIEQENQGQSVARNKGIKIATGDAIYFFDSDDILTTDALSSWAEKFIKNPELDSILFNAKTFSEDSKIDFNPVYERKHYNSVESDSSDYILKSLLDNTYFVSPCCYVTKVKHIKSLMFEAGIKHEDELYYPKLFVQKKLKILVINETLFHRRVRAGSTMTGGNYQVRQLSYLKIIKILLDELQQPPRRVDILIINHAVDNYISSLLINKILITNIKKRKTLIKIMLTLKRKKSLKIKQAILTLIPEIKTLIKIKNKLRHLIHK
ncbi:glycosyltransferase family A protein [Pseudoalteromonas lipolytica]|jgi:glycosyltransferase involved in cell wall biosynthesis